MAHAGRISFDVGEPELSGSIGGHQWSADTSDESLTRALYPRVDGVLLQGIDTTDPPAGFTNGFTITAVMGGVLVLAILPADVDHAAGATQRRLEDRDRRLPLARPDRDRRTRSTRPRCHLDRLRRSRRHTIAPNPSTRVPAGDLRRLELVGSRRPRAPTTNRHTTLTHIDTRVVTCSEPGRACGACTALPVW